MSMTGFGRSEFSSGQRTYRLELRSVNNRFLDIRARLPWIDGELESRVLATIRQQISRGRVEVTVFADRTPDVSGTLQLHERLAQDVSTVLRQLAQILSCDLATAAHLLQPLPELVIKEVELPQTTNETWHDLKAGLERALAGLLAMRKQEGQALAADLNHHVDEIERWNNSIQTLSASEPDRQRSRLEGRLGRFHLEGIPVDPARIAEEVALYADRCDVSEELVRIASHIEQLRAILRQEGEIGRKIEFMTQELNRELNTIGSKSLSADVAHLVVDAQSAVEKMREQAQNVE